MNAQSAGAALDQLVDYKAEGTATASQEELLYVVSAQTSAALLNTTTALSGELHGALFASAPLATRWMTDSIVKQLTYGNAPAGAHGVWVDMGANRSDWDSDSFASGFDTTLSQIAIGWDLLSLEEHPHRRRLLTRQGRRVHADGLRLDDAGRWLRLRPGEGRRVLHRCGRRLRRQRLGDRSTRSGRADQFTQHRTSAAARRPHRWASVCR